MIYVLMIMFSFLVALMCAFMAAGTGSLFWIILLFLNTYNTIQGIANLRARIQRAYKEQQEKDKDKVTIEA